MGLFGNRSYEEFATILQAANAAFGKGGPDGWTQLKMSDLGIDQFGDTFTSPNGRGKAIDIWRACFAAVDAEIHEGSVVNQD